MELITSAYNSTFKHWLKLIQQRKARYLSCQTLLDGIHLIESALQHRFPLQRLIIAESVYHSALIQNLLRLCEAPVTCVSDRLFAKLSTLVSTTGIMALINLPKTLPVRQQGFILALEGLQDPGNLGTILRTAFAAGVDQVWLDAQCADMWAPKVLRAGMGAHFALECVTHIDLSSALANFAGRVFATFLDKNSQSLYQTDLTANDLVFVMGNEGSGISAAICSKIDAKIMIPMHAGIESLNVSTATAICLYERYRQHTAKREAT